MLVGSIDRAVEAVPLVIDVGLQGTKQPSPLAALGPPIEPIEHGFPWPKLFGQVSPRSSGPPPPQHRFDEVAVVVAPLADRIIGYQERMNPRPLLVAQL